MDHHRAAEASQPPRLRMGDITPQILCMVSAWAPYSDTTMMHARTGRKIQIDPRGPDPVDPRGRVFDNVGILSFLLASSAGALLDIIPPS